jgi:transposase
MFEVGCAEGRRGDGREKQIFEVAGVSHMNVSVDRLPLRISALLLLNMGERTSDVSRYLGVSRVTLIEWARRFKKGGWSGLLRENRGRHTTRHLKRPKDGAGEARADRRARRAKHGAKALVTKRRPQLKRRP